MNEKPWFVYMIRTHDAQLYTGITTDIQRRWHEHLSGKGGARYFRARKPQALCLLEEHLNRSTASKREAAIKKLSKIEKELLVSTGIVPEGLTLRISATPND
ncbi:MAG: GIY-YIG nuclease family protein [Pseudomonadota bacterium]